MGRRPVGAGLGGRRRSARGRRRARGRLQPHPDGPHDERRAAARRELPRSDDRGDRRRHPDGHQPVVVDRRPAAQLPVRVRDRLGDQGRQADPDAAESDLYRDQPALLGRDGHDREPRRVDLLGHPELRQGPADADGTHRPPVRARALPRDQGRGPGMSGIHDAPADAVAERVLELVGRRSSSAEAEVNVRIGTSALTRFANGAIHQNVAGELRRVLLRVALDGRVSAAGLAGPTGDDELETLVDEVFEAAAVSPVDPDWPGVATPADVPPVDHWDEATAAASPDERAVHVAAFVASAGGLVTAGAVSTDAVRAAFSNTAGQALTGRYTVAALDAIARTDTSDGVARSASVRLGDIDAAAAGAVAAAKASDGANPGHLDPGRYEVVLEPSCVKDLVDFLLNYGFAGRAVLEGRSFLRPGERQFDESIVISQDVAPAPMAGLGFDAEGTPRASLDLVRDGTAHAVLHDRRTARRAGTSSTGNAALGPNPYGALPASVVLEGGTTDPGRLIEGVGRGLLVTDFWYTRILDPRTLVVTGLTRNGVWLVEDGRIVRPVSNLRFTQSYAEALGPGAVEAIGDRVELFPDETDGFLAVPALHLGSWSFTGGSKG